MTKHEQDIDDIRIIAENNFRLYQEAQRVNAALLEAVESLIANNGTGAMEWAIDQAKAALANAKGAKP